MIHTVYIDDATPKGKSIIRQLQKAEKEVRFDKPFQGESTDPNYITSNEFRAEVKKGLVEKLKAHGRL